jgi:hypothetical protein
LIVCLALTTFVRRISADVGLGLDGITFLFQKEPTRWPTKIVLNRCGKLKNDYRYSNTLGWNTFPVPKLTDQNKRDLSRGAEEILLARSAHFPASLADLYDWENMPDDLKRAHETNDEVIERIYIGRRFRNDTERLEKLFELYAKMTSEKPQPKKKAMSHDAR